MSLVPPIHDPSIEGSTQRLTMPPTIAMMARRLQSALGWMNDKYTQQRLSKRLRVAETVSLGEKRFISILQVDGNQFLIGGTASSVSVLATFESDAPEFAQVLKIQSSVAAEQQ